MARARKKQVVPLEAAIQATGRASDELWSSLAGVVRRHGCRSVMFTSVEPGAGTSLIAAACLGGLVRNTRTRACLVEADLANPVLASYVGVKPKPGLSEAMASDASFEEQLSSVSGFPGLEVLPAGATQPVDPLEFSTDSFAKRMDSLRDRGDLLVIDAPPLLTRPEARLMLDYVDGVIVVIRARFTMKRNLKNLQRLLDDLDVPIFGTIVNRYRPEVAAFRI